MNWEHVAVVDGVIRGRSRYDCQLLSPPLGIMAENYPELLVRMRSSLSGSGETFYAAPDQSLADSRKATHVVTAGSDWRLYRIDLTGARGAWQGPIERLRFDPLNPGGAEVEIDFIALLPDSGTLLINGGAELADVAGVFEWTRMGAQADLAQVISPGAGSELAFRVAPGGAWESHSLDMSFLGELAVRGVYRGVHGGVVALRFYDLGGQIIDEQRWAFPAAESWSEFSGQCRCPRRAARATLCLLGAAQGVADYDDLQVKRTEPGSIVAGPPLKPRWQAAWIWHPEALSRDRVRVHFRYRFSLPGEDLARALLQITVDDGYALSVNGQEVSRTFAEADGWRTPELLDLAAVVRPGENRIEIEAEDIASAQGLIAEGVFLTVDGGVITVLSGADWECALDPAGPWVASRELGKVPMQPWGDLAYEVMTPPVPVSLRLSELPERVAPGARLRLTLDAVAGQEVTWPVYIEAVLTGPHGVVQQAWAPAVLLAAGTQKGGAARLTEWPLQLPLDAAGVEVTLSFRLYGGVCAPPVPVHTLVAGGSQGSSEYPRARVGGENGMGRLWINDQPIDPTQALFTAPDALHLANATAAGVPIWGVSLRELGFFEDGYDYTRTDALLRGYLEANPDAWLLLNFVMDTRYHGWWLRQHPEARCRLEDGSDIIGDYRGNRRMVPSIASPLWRDMYSEVLRRLIRHLSQTPFASRIIGFQPCGGITWEWFHWGSQSGELVDYSAAGQADFRRWLRQTYGDAAALQRAWKRPGLTFEQAAIPSEQARRSPAHGIFFDPGRQQDVLDYNRYQHDVVVDTIRHFARVIKEETGGHSLAGTYYGYTIHLAESPGFCQGSGHFSLARALAAPEIDYFVAPMAYAWREVTGTAATMVPGASMLLNGKMFWNQADLRTHWAIGAGHGRPPDLAGSLACMRREAARNLAAGTAIQWYDFSKGWTFGDERLAAEVGRLLQVNRVREQLAPQPRRQRLAVVVDEMQMGTFDPFRAPYGQALVYRQREQLARSGVAHDVYLFSDVLAHPELLEHRVFLFLNLFRLTSEQRRFLSERVFADGRIIVVIGPLGLLHEDGFDIAGTAALLGQPMRESFEEIALQCRMLDSLPAPWDAVSGVEFGIGRTFPPIAVPTAPVGRILGRFTARDEAALVLQERAACTLIWSAVPGLPPAVIQAVASLGNVPVVNRTGEAVYAGAGIVGIHSRNSGSVPLSFPGGGAAVDLLSGRIIEPDIADGLMQIPMQPGETVILRPADTGER